MKSMEQMVLSSPMSPTDADCIVHQENRGLCGRKTDLDYGWTRPLPESASPTDYQAEMKHFVECAEARPRAKPTRMDTS